VHRVCKCVFDVEQAERRHSAAGGRLDGRHPASSAAAAEKPGEPPPHVLVLDYG